jgi:hypothetical protein
VHLHKQSMLPSCGSLLFAGKLFSLLNTTNVYRHDSCYFFLVFLLIHKKDIISSRQITKLLVVFYNIFYIQNTTKITQCQSLKQVEKIYYLCIGIFLLRISIHIFCVSHCCLLACHISIFFFEIYLSI